MQPFCKLKHYCSWSYPAYRRRAPRRSDRSQPSTGFRWQPCCLTMNLCSVQCFNRLWFVRYGCVNRSISVALNPWKLVKSTTFYVRSHFPLFLFDGTALILRAINILRDGKFWCYNDVLFLPACRMFLGSQKMWGLEGIIIHGRTTFVNSLFL